MGKKIYTAPQAEVIRFATEDVIVTSLIPGNGTDGNIEVEF